MTPEQLYDACGRGWMQELTDERQCRKAIDVARNARGLEPVNEYDTRRSWRSFYDLEHRKYANITFDEDGCPYFAEGEPKWIDHEEMKRHWMRSSGRIRSMDRPGTLTLTLS
jgi:hypothetical protein